MTTKRPPKAEKLAAPLDPVVRRRFVVKLQDGCWLADGEGDPPRTLVLSNARRFTTRLKAGRALNDARKYRPFRRAEIHGEDQEPIFDQ